MIGPRPEFQAPHLAEPSTSAVQAKSPGWMHVCVLDAIAPAYSNAIEYRIRCDATHAIADIQLAGVSCSAVVACAGRRWTCADPRIQKVWGPRHGKCSRNICRYTRSRCVLFFVILEVVCLHVEHRNCEQSRCFGRVHHLSPVCLSAFLPLCFCYGAKRWSSMANAACSRAVEW